MNVSRQSEAGRLAALKRYDILDTPSEQEFDDLTQIAAEVCCVPIALVSLVDDRRQWFKSKIGLAAGETPRAISFCAHAIQGEDVFEIPDAQDDRRFRNNPLVTGAPGIRFYAGMPLTTPDGYNLGTLCVIDCVPRHLTKDQLHALGRLGRQVMALLELRLLNRRLGEQVAFQHSILSSAAAGIISTTPEGIITEFNTAAQKMLGYARDEMVGEATPAVFHDVAEVQARAKELRSELGRPIAPGFEVFVAKALEGEPETREWTHIRKDRSRFPVQLSVSAMRDDSGRLTGFLGIVRDITERRQREQEIRGLNESLEKRVLERTAELESAVKSLRESEERFRAMFEQAAVGVAIADQTTGRFLEINERFCAIAGRTRDQMLGVTLSDIVHRDYLDEQRKLRKKLLHGKIAEFTVESRCVRPDASIVWVHLHASRISANRGQPDRLLAVVEDINDRKNAEAQYRREVEFNKTLVNHTSAIILLLDQECRIVHVNDATLKILGYSRGDLVGRTPWEVGMINRDANGGSADRLAPLFAGKATSPCEAFLRSKTGEQRIVELSSIATRLADGAIDRIIVTGTDLSERNRLQSEVLKISEAEQARIGHNLHDGVGQTMTGIGSLIEALESELTGSQRKSAARIRELVQAASHEVRRMSHGLSPAAVKNRSLGGALQLQAEIVRTDLRRGCECFIQPGIRIKDPAREMHLFRIAQEAVNNAIRHGHARNIRISLQRLAGRECVLKVEDDGSGMRDTPTNKKSKGIGMQVMDYRANLIHGALEITTEKGKGVTVACRFAS